MAVKSDNHVFVPLIRSRQVAAIERVQPGEWCAVGLIDQLKEPDALLPATIGWHGIHVIRNAQGAWVGRLNAATENGRWFSNDGCA